MMWMAFKRKSYAAVLRQDPCVLCGGVSETIDHIEPRILGGVDHWSNAAPMCRRCNPMKGRRTIIEALMGWRWRTREDREWDAYPLVERTPKVASQLHQRREARRRASNHAYIVRIKSAARFHAPSYVWSQPAGL